MSTTTSTNKDVLTASAIAKELGVPDAQVKKAIAALDLAPAATKGACRYYARDAVAKIKRELS